MGDGLFRLDLSNGTLRFLAFMPNGGHVLDLSVDPSGSALGVRSRWLSLEMPRRRTEQRSAWEAWDWRRLLAQP